MLSATYKHSETHLNLFITQAIVGTYLKIQVNNGRLRNNKLVHYKTTWGNYFFLNYTVLKL